MRLTFGVFGTKCLLFPFHSFISCNTEYASKLQRVSGLPTVQIIALLMLVLHPSTTIPSPPLKHNHNHKQNTVAVTFSEPKAVNVKWFCYNLKLTYCNFSTVTHQHFCLCLLRRLGNTVDFPRCLWLK